MLRLLFREISLKAEPSRLMSEAVETDQLLLLQRLCEALALPLPLPFSRPARILGLIVLESMVDPGAFLCDAGTEDRRSKQRGIWRRLVGWRTTSLSSSPFVEASSWEEDRLLVMDERIGMTTSRIYFLFGGELAFAGAGGAWLAVTDCMIDLLVCRSAWD